MRQELEQIGDNIVDVLETCAHLLTSKRELS